MKPSALIIVTLMAVMFNLSYSQNKEPNNNYLKKLYFKAGIELNNYSNVSGFKYASAVSNGAANNVSAAIAYQYDKRIQLELQYKYMSGFSYSAQTCDCQYEIHGERFFYSANGSLNSHYINLRANYFVNEDRRENPIYFIGTLSFAVQNVNDWEEFKYSNRTEIVNTKHIRYLLGPEAGFGIFFDLGYINFQTEFTFTSRVVPYGKHRNEGESSLNFSFSPVIKF